MKFYIVFLLAVVCFTGCQKINMYEKRIAIPNHKWEKSFTPEFEITTTSKEAKNIMYIIVRHTNNFKYRNVHCKITITTPSKEKIELDQEVMLTKNNQNMEWANSGMDDIFEVKFPVNKPITGEKGTYKIKLENIMRDNPLEEVLNVGVGLERFSN